MSINILNYNQPDLLDSPDVGRIGPITSNRPGDHRENGFLLAQGQGIAPNSNLSTGRALYIGATMLNLMGATIPDYFDGEPLLESLATLS